MTKQSILSIALSALVGAASVLSFAPFEYSLIMLFCLAYLFNVLSNSSSVKQAIYHAYSFGFAQFLAGVSWVYVSLHTFGNMPLLMAGIAVVLFVAFLALYFALTAYLFFKLKTLSYLLNALLFAAIWIAIEWLRSVVLTGFPWLDIGYSQTTKWLSQYAPIGGVYLVGLLTAFCSALMAIIIKGLYEKKAKTFITPSIMVLSLFIGGWALKSFEWSQPSGKTYSIGLVQANIPIEKKWQENFRDELISRYVRLSKADPVDLLVFPETALPVFRHNVTPDYWTSLRSHHGGILSGITELGGPDVGGAMYNSAVVNCEAEDKTVQAEQVFRKTHLVPFGEYLPLRSMFSWVLDYLQLPMSDFSAWEGKQSIRCGGVNIAVSICYEDAFALEIARGLGDGGLMINISEDAWFGDSLAPHQRQQMAQMRAIETARPMVRSSNSGPSTFIDHNGLILQESEMFDELMLRSSVQPREGDTLFVRFGAWLIYACLVFCFFMVLRKFARIKC